MLHKVVETRASNAPERHFRSLPALTLIMYNFINEGAENDVNEWWWLSCRKKWKWKIRVPQGGSHLSLAFVWLAITIVEYD